MLSRLFVLVTFAVGIACFASPANAATERRVALVIGNANYVNTAALKNPGYDASDMADSLKQLGFEVILGLDLDQQRFATTIEQFARKLDGADVGLLFYAGHGLQIGERNYLVSTNARLDNEFLISSETIDLESVVRLMESKTATNLVFVDACRNNPLTEQLKRSLSTTKRSASLGRGLARIEPQGRDTLIAFAAAPGQEAADGANRNSPFTTALLKYLPTAGLEVSVMLKEVSADVRKVTGNEQRPQQLSDMSRTFYFAEAEQAVSNKTTIVISDASVGPAIDLEQRKYDVTFWNSVQAANDCESMRAYLQRFPDGAFIDLARVSERRLCATRQVTVVDSTLPTSVPPTPVVQTAPAPHPAIVTALANPQPVPAAVQPQLPNSDLVYNAQLELIRVGCASDKADGKWDTAREAAVRFNKNSKSKLDVSAGASEAMIATLRQEKGRVCALECERGYKARGNVCVAVDEGPRNASASRRRTPRQIANEYVAPPSQVYYGGPGFGRPAVSIGFGGFGFGHHHF